MASRRLPGVAEQKVEIFCLSGFVEDRGQICFSRSSQCATLHPSCARPMRNAITCLTEINQNQTICVPTDYYSFFSIHSFEVFLEIMSSVKWRNLLRDGCSLPTWLHQEIEKKTTAYILLEETHLPSFDSIHCGWIVRVIDQLKT